MTLTREHQHEPRGVLRFTASVLLAEAYLGPLIAEYLEAHPHVELDMNLSARAFDLIADGFDLALRVSQPQPSSYIMRKIARAPAFICASPRYLERRGAPESLDALADHAAIVYSPTRQRVPWELENGRGDRSTVHVDGPVVVKEPPNFPPDFAVRMTVPGTPLPTAISVTDEILAITHNHERTNT